MQGFGIWRGFVRSWVIEGVFKGSSKCIEIDRRREGEGGNIPIDAFSGCVLVFYLPSHCKNRVMVSRFLHRIQPFAVARDTPGWTHTALTAGTELKLTA